MFGARMMFGAVGAVLLALGMVFAMVRKSAADHDLAEELHVEISRCKGYAANPAFYDYIADQCHKDAFANNYTFELRGRRVSAGLNDAYFDEVIECMIQKAKDEGSPQVAKELEELFTEPAPDAPPAK